MSKTIGTCSECGGPVEVPSAWMCIHPRVPRCRNCGAEPETAFGPVIPMKKPRQLWTDEQMEKWRQYRPENEVK